MKTTIKAELVAHSTNQQGDELISILATFPRIILSEINTHRMLSKNTSSSRAIPFSKMVESVQNDPFIPIAWQKEHTGMQGYEYLVDRKHENAVYEWLKARDFAVKQANIMNSDGVTKQLTNRLLEPFMWTTMLITGSREGWQNFFNLRCPQYSITITSPEDIKGKVISFKSKKEFIKFGNNLELTENWTELDWLLANKGQAEIHMMALAEKIYDAIQESKPKVLTEGEWHIPFEDKIEQKLTGILSVGDETTIMNPFLRVKIATALSARTSYTVVGDEKEIDYEKMIALHDRLIAQNPPHSSPFEHCARAMSEEEYESFRKGKHEVTLMDNTENQYWFIEDDSGEKGWCNNLKGFIPYRYLVDNKINI